MKMFVAIGSNQGRSLSILARAVRAIARSSRVRLRRVSPVYKTQAVGGPEQRDYLNGVLEIETPLDPVNVMGRLLEIEKELGRVRRVKWGPRRIDLDLLAAGQLTLRSKTLRLPHPRYHRRRFVLTPFCDIAPRFLHPRLKIENRELLRKLTPMGQRVTILALWNGTRFSPSRKKRNPKPPSLL